MLPKPSRYTPCIEQKWFLHGLHSKKYEAWKHKGVTRLIDLTADKNMMNKQSLAIKLLQLIPWFQYLQIQHLWTYLNLTTMLSWLLTMYKLHKPKKMEKKGFISTFYNILDNTDTTQSVSYQMHRQTDCSLLVMTESWQMVWKSRNLQSYGLKTKHSKWLLDGISHQCYWHTGKMCSPKCWKGYREDKIYTCYWINCAKIKPFWKTK